jgi:hypothetical protein
MDLAKEAELAHRAAARKRLFNKVEPYIWIAPSLILMSIFILIPIGMVFRMAFSDVSKTGKIRGFAGFENFVDVINNAEFSRVLSNTVIWTILVVVLSTVLGFILALLLNNAFKGILMALDIRINRDVDFRFAAQWFSITHDCAEYVLSREAWLEKVFRHTNTPDEVFLATLIWDSPFRERLFDPLEHVQNQDIYNTANLRFIDWTRGKSIRHPWTFTLDDKDLLLGLPHFWARKFDERVDTRIIDYFCDALKTKD